MKVSWVAVVLVASLTAGCGEDAGTHGDAATGDGDATSDAAADSGVVDARREVDALAGFDAGSADAMPRDAGPGCLVLSTTLPAANAANVPATQVVILQFNKPIDPGTARDITATSAAGTAVAYREVAADDATIVHVGFDGPMASATVYTITAGVGVTAWDGCTLALPESFSFTTAAP